MHMCTAAVSYACMGKYYNTAVVRTSSCESYPSTAEASPFLGLDIRCGAHRLVLFHTRSFLLFHSPTIRPHQSCEDVPPALVCMYFKYDNIHTIISVRAAILFPSRWKPPSFATAAVIRAP